jgi:hypothetical protein
MWFIKLWLRRAFKRSEYQILAGRYRDRTKPSSGRFSRGQVDELLKNIWDHLDSLLPEASWSSTKPLAIARIFIWPLQLALPITHF